MTKTLVSAALYFAVLQNNYSEYYYSSLVDSQERKFKLRIFGKYTGPKTKFTSHLDCRTEPGSQGSLYIEPR
jgi:hypothetical protein